MTGLITIKSDYSIRETVRRIIAQIEEEKWHVFAHIDHAKEGREKGMDLRPTELILFGNPKIGTKIMQDRQISAIDLPMKLLAWEDESGQSHITYNDMNWLKQRHALTDDETIKTIATVVENICRCIKK